MESKLCKKCGRPAQRRLCAECRRASGYDASYFQKHVEAKSAAASKRKRELQDWYRALKTGRACNLCGGVFNPVCCDFDHLPGHKKFMEVSKMVRLGYEKEKVIAELNKCQFLCSNCHRLLTHQRRIKGTKT